MPITTLKIEHILGGIAPSENYSQPGQFMSSLAVDPELPKDDSARLLSGMIRPTAMAKFSGSTVTGIPKWIIPNPVDADKNFVYADDGKIHLVNSSLTMGSDVSTLSTSVANGAAYYKNYGYFARNTEIARYRADGGASIDTAFWGTTLGLTALSNKTYPTIRGAVMPNHVMHVHPSNTRLYICDVDANDHGCLHLINTEKTSVEGDTNNTTVPSAYSVVTFGFKEYPTCIESYGTALVIGCINSVNTSVTNSKAFSLIIWDTTSSEYQSISHHYSDPIISAIKNVNGIIYVFSGTANGGSRVSIIASNYTLKEIAYIPQAYPPLAGAVDSCINRVIWGGATTHPIEAGCVWAYGSKSPKLGLGVHAIYKSNDDGGGTPHVTCVKYLEQNSTRGVLPIIGWRTATSQGLDKTSTTYGTWYFYSEKFRIGKEFTIKRITIPLLQTLVTNMTITPSVVVDDDGTTTALRVINSTNFPSLRRAPFVDCNVKGYNNFYIKLVGSGTALLTVGLPIYIEVDIYGT